MNSAEKLATELVNTFIVKIKEDKLDIKKIKYWGFFGDPSIYKMRRIGVYGYIEFEDNPTIASSLDEDMDKFDYDMEPKNYLRYIEENIIVVANKLFVDFLQNDA